MRPEEIEEPKEEVIEKPITIEPSVDVEEEPEVKEIEVKDVTFKIEKAEPKPITPDFIEEEYYSRNYLMSLKLSDLKEFGKEKFGLTDQDYIGKKKKQIAFIISKKQRLLKGSKEV
jgi:hypothetical protein